MQDQFMLAMWVIFFYETIMVLETLRPTSCTIALPFPCLL